MRNDEPKSFEFGPSQPTNARAVGDSRRRIVWLVLTVLAIAIGAGAYLYEFKRETLRGFLRGTLLEPPASVTTVYKWKDRHGSWQLTGEPPDDGISYEVLEYRSDTNVLPLVPEEN